MKRIAMALALALLVFGGMYLMLGMFVGSDGRAPRWASAPTRS